MAHANRIRRRQAFLGIAAALALLFGNAGAQHAHHEDHAEEDCLICAIAAPQGGDSQVAIGLAAPPIAALAVRPLPVRQPRTRPFLHHRQRAPPPYLH